MRHRRSVRVQLFWAAVHSVIRLSDRLRSAGFVILITGALVTGGAAWLTSSASAHIRARRAWNQFRGHSPLLKTDVASAKPPALTAISGYVLTTFDVPGAGSSTFEGTFGVSIDAAGDITGTYLDANKVAHGYLRSANGSIATFDAPGSGSSSSIGMGGTFINIQGTEPVAINASATVAGTYVDSNSCYHGFVRTSSGTITEFDAPGGTTQSNCAFPSSKVGTRPIAINASGTIAGAYMDENLAYHGFIRAANGTITTFDAETITNPVDAGSGTIPLSIDSNGNVAGALVDATSLYHGFIRTAAGVVTIFDVPGSAGGDGASRYEGTIALSMNDSGTLVGTYTDVNFGRHGFTRSPAGAISTFDVPGAGSGPSAGSLEEGTAGFSIDSAGDISGMYLDPNSRFHGFLLPAGGSASTVDISAEGTGALQGTGIFSMSATRQLAGTYADSNLVFHGFVYSPANGSCPNPNPNPNPAAFAEQGDFNGDCKSDILWRNTSTGEVDMWLMNGTGISSGANLGTISTAWVIAAAGDFNGDGKSDILWRNSSTGEVDIWLMNGTVISNASSLGTIATNWTIAAVGDFNGDGKSDILWRNTSTGEVDMWTMNGTSVTSGTNLGTISTAWSVVGAGDFNGDGKADILWRNTSTGEVDLWIMNGTSIASGTNLGTIATNWSISGIGDFNGDGKSDILWRNTSTGEVDMWLMNGTGITSAANLATISTAWSIAGTGDFNGDGKADILWRNTSTGEVDIWLMNDTGITSAASLGTIATNWQIATLSP